MFERFSKPARAAVVGAQEEARELRSPHIDVEHLLLGVLFEAETPLRNLLADLGITYDDARVQVSRKRDSDPLGEADAEALKSIGIDLDAVRESLEASFGQDALDRGAPEPRRRWRGGHIPFTSGAKKTLELSLREALAHKDDHIGSEHVLLGIVRAPSPIAEAIITAHVPLADLRTKVLGLLDRAA
jgi:ATP-dependent Clp protease ATP-binding subunit ClpA